MVHRRCAYASVFYVTLASAAEGRTVQQNALQPAPAASSASWRSRADNALQEEIMLRTVASLTADPPRAPPKSATFPLAALALVILGSSMIAGCGGISDLTRERVARSETAVKQAAQTLGRSEAGALELQRARDDLHRAQQALDQQDETMAERYARQAELNAELAVAKSENAAARKAADQVLTSIRMLREEASRQ